MMLKKNISSHTTLSIVLHIIASAIILGAVLFSLSSCVSETQQARDEQLQNVKEAALRNIAQSNANLEPIGDHLSTTGREAEGSAISAQTATIFGAYRLLAAVLGATVPATPATVTLSEWRKAQGDAAASRELAERLGSESDKLRSDLTAKDTKLKQLEEQLAKEKNSWWGWATTGGLVTTVGAIGLFAARLLNIPGINLIYDPLVKRIGGPFVAKLINKSQELDEKVAVATTAVMASDVARSGLEVLDNYIAKDPDLAKKVADIVLSATKGQAETIQGAFKVIAKGVAVDDGKTRQVDQFLDDVRSSMPTTLGTPSVLLRRMIG